MKSGGSEDRGLQRQVRSEMWKAAKGQHVLKRAMLAEDCEEVGLECHRQGSEYRLTAKGTDTSVVANSLQTAWEAVQLFRIGIEIGQRAAKESAM